MGQRRVMHSCSQWRPSSHPEDSTEYRTDHDAPEAEVSAVKNITSFLPTFQLSLVTILSKQILDRQVEPYHIY